MTSPDQPAWTVGFDDGFSKTIRDSFRLLADCIRNKTGLEHEERYLKERAALKAFRQYTHHDCSAGPDRKFIEVRKHGQVPAFHYRQLSSWTGYCTLDKTKKTIQWNFATHDGEFC
jgi:hypothetical protein